LDATIFRFIKGALFRNQELETQFKERGFPSAGLAWIYLGLGDFDKFFQCLNQAYKEHNPLLFALKVLPEFDNVRQDPRFQELLHRLHLD